MEYPPKNPCNPRNSGHFIGSPVMPTSDFGIILELRRCGITVLSIQTITFKVSDAEASLIHALAKQEQASLSEYLP